LSPARAAGLLLAGALGLALPARAQGVPEVIVCSSHHHVLSHWLLAAERGAIPSAGITVVHFDAHPDLAVPPRPLQREWRSRPGLLVAASDIASFQLAAAWVGLVSRVVWLRPAWAEQLADGPRRFRVGYAADGAMRVDDPSDYYVLDGAWAPGPSLRDAVDLRVDVLTLARAASGGLHEPEAPILDIDLDGFATRNPSADRVRALGVSDADIARLRATFAPRNLALGEAPQERIASLERLLGAVAAAARGSLVERASALWTLWRLGLGPGDLYHLQGLVSGDALRGLPLDVLLEEGRRVVGIPERPPDPAEIEATAAHLADLLRRGALRPRLVTIARSVDDGFTPAAAWPAIERRTLQALRDALGPIEVRYDRGVRPVPPG